MPQLVKYIIVCFHLLDNDLHIGTNKHEMGFILNDIGKLVMVRITCYENNFYAFHTYTHSFAQCHSNLIGRYFFSVMWNQSLGTFEPCSSVPTSKRKKRVSLSFLCSCYKLAEVFNDK